ncbi:MAG TPA: 2OG-Fe dioxygenase family protein [Alphaproteobacteria bacterium]|nr:2OG-Fe dioxygenase family protein [Alphaproteobacteria bacterium]
MRGMLEACGSLKDWDAFAASWNDLKTDEYMADKGRYRKRRYAVYHADVSGTVTREGHQPHYQTLDYNPLHGGVERWFEPVTDAIGTSASMQTILKFCTQLFTQMKNASVAWHIEAHQFRIEAGKDMKGQPTPEGMHRDGRDYVLVLLIKRENIQSGVTSIHSLEKKPLGSFTLAQPFDAALVDDARVFHGVTAVEPVDAAKPAYRDVLVVTFKAE